jgi:hypothetical protein
MFKMNFAYLTFWCLVWTNPILSARLGAMHQDPLDVDTMGGRHRGIKARPPPPPRKRTKSPTKSPTKPPTKQPTKAPVDPSWRLRSESVQGLVLHITFSWSVDSVLTDDSLNPLTADLDGGVYFLGNGQGLFCNPQSSTYMSFSGDSYGPNGSENFDVYLGKSFADRQWNESTAVELRAGWVESDFGQAVVTMSTSRVLTNGTMVNDNNSISFGIRPRIGQYNVCAPPVATATVDIGLNGQVSIAIPKW